MYMGLAGHGASRLVTLLDTPPEFGHELSKPFLPESYTGLISKDSFVPQKNMIAAGQHEFQPDSTSQDVSLLPALNSGETLPSTVDASVMGGKQKPQASLIGSSNPSKTAVLSMEALKKTGVSPANSPVVLHKDAVPPTLSASDRVSIFGRIIFRFRMILMASLSVLMHNTTEMSLSSSAVVRQKQLDDEHASKVDPRDTFTPPNPATDTHKLFTPPAF